MFTGRDTSDCLSGLSETGHSSGQDLVGTEERGSTTSLARGPSPSQRIFWKIFLSFTALRCAAFLLPPRERRESERARESDLRPEARERRRPEIQFQIRAGQSRGSDFSMGRANSVPAFGLINSNFCTSLITRPKERERKAIQKHIHWSKFCWRSVDGQRLCYVHTWDLACP